MPLLPGTGGLHGKQLVDIIFVDFQKHVCEEWFRVLDGNGHNVSLTLRSIALFLRAGIILGMHRCPECNGPARIES